RISVVIDDVDDGARQIDLSGSTDDVAPGTTVTLVITDQFGNCTTVVTTTTGDGSYDLDNVDIAGLIDGPLTVTASTTDHNGHTVQDSAGDELDALAGAISVSIGNVHAGNELAVPISGTTA